MVIESPTDGNEGQGMYENIHFYFYFPSNKLKILPVHLHRLGPEKILPVLSKAKEETKESEVHRSRAPMGRRHGCPLHGIILIRSGKVYRVI